MKNIYFLLCSLFIGNLTFGQTTIAIENFDSGTPNWTNNIASLLFVDPTSSSEGLFIQAASSVNPNFSGNSAYGRDLAGESGEPTIDPINFIFNDINVSGYTDVTLSFDYAVSANADIGTYTVVIDGSDEASVEYYNDPDSGFEFGTISVNIPDGTTTVGLKIGGTLNGGSDVLELDNFKIVGNSSACSASLSAKTPVCDNITVGTDTYSTTFDFLNGTETDAFTVAVSAGSASVSTISADGLITVTGINEGTDVTLTLTNENCTLTQTTVSPTCEPAITSCFDISNGAEKFEMFTVATNSDNDVWTESSGTYNMNGYCGGGCEEVVNTWLLFGPLDLTSVSDLALKFNAQENFGDTPLAINYTAAYSGCPDTTSWSSLQTITESDEGDVEIDLSALTGTAVFIGIQYYDDGVDGYSNWDLSNVELTTYNNCPVLGARPTSDCPTLSIVDSEQREFSIFPNPTSTGFVNIVSAHSEAISVNVYDMLGKQVINETIANNRLNVSTLNAGVYIMKISQGNTATTQKIVIK